MARSLITIVLFLALLIAAAYVLRRLQQRNGPGASRPGFLGAFGGLASTGGGPSRLVSSLAIGPQQRVVTVEVGTPQARTWLVLGVAGQSISCLHVLPVPETPFTAAAAGLQADGADSAGRTGP
ncbi:MAG: flagellar biosynthesis protein FliO [Variovorax sp.]|nr:MAG: flagellar biosynthesis protein FliO [Variovorax sp.]